MNPDEQPSPSLSPNHERSPLRQIRTFQGDVAEALKNQNESLVSIQAKEVERHKAEERKIEEKQQQVQAPEVPLPKAPADLPIIEKPARREPIIVEAPRPILEDTPQMFTPEELEARHKKRKGLLLALGTLLLLGGGIYGGWNAYTQYKTKTTLPIIEIIPNSFISSDGLVDINALTLDRTKLIERLRQEKTRTGKGIVQIELRKGETTNASFLSTESLLTLLQTEAPGRLVRAFNSLFMLGTLGDGTSRHVFMLIKLDSFENAFGGMLEWEETLQKDMLPLFASEGVVSEIPLQSPWSDITINNKDARILKDSTGHTVLLYAFVDNKYLLMTDEESTLRTLLTRITAEKLVR
jgi:hypothetical protein